MMHLFVNIDCESGQPFITLIFFSIQESFDCFYRVSSYILTYRFIDLHSNMFCFNNMLPAIMWMLN